MPMTYTIDTPARLVTARPAGRLTLEDLLAYQREVWSRPETTGFDEVVEMDEVTRIDSGTPAELRQLASLAAAMDRLRGPSRLAIVAEADFHYGLARMYKTFRDDSPGSTRETQVFRTRDAARQWLGR